MRSNPVPRAQGHLQEQLRQDSNPQRDRQAQFLSRDNPLGKACRGIRSSFIRAPWLSNPWARARRVLRSRASLLAPLPDPGHRSNTCSSPGGRCRGRQERRARYLRRLLRR